MRLIDLLICISYLNAAFGSPPGSVDKDLLDMVYTQRFVYVSLTSLDILF